MNVASLELCKELYELSGWGGRHTMNISEHAWYDVRASDHKSGEWEETSQRYEVLCVDREARYYNHETKVGFEQSAWQSEYICAAYDLGCLLRKLPAPSVIQNLGNSKYRAIYAVDYEDVANTPEDAAALLAIQLFKQGVLKKQLTPHPKERKDV